MVYLFIGRLVFDYIAIVSTRFSVQSLHSYLFSKLGHSDHLLSGTKPCAVR